jgi:hypothetical protein
MSCAEVQTLHSQNLTKAGFGGDGDATRRHASSILHEHGNYVVPKVRYCEIAPFCMTKYSVGGNVSDVPVFTDWPRSQRPLQLDATQLRREDQLPL